MASGSCPAAGRAPSVRELLELERQIYQESIDRTRQQREQLALGSLEEFARRCRPFEAARDREQEVALARLRLSKHDALTLLDFDLQQAEDVYRSDTRELKRQLLASTRRRRRELERRLRALDAPSQPPAPAARADFRRAKPATKGDARSSQTLEKQLRKAQRRTRAAFNFRHLAHGVLPTAKRIAAEVTAESNRLQRALTADTQDALSPEMEVTLSRDGQKLAVRAVGSGEGGAEQAMETFHVADAVVLRSGLSEEDFYGYVAALSSEELRLVLVCGTHARVTLSKLRSGQCSLTKQQKQELPSPWRQNEGEGGGGGEGEDDVTTTELEDLLRDPPDARRRALAAMNRLKRKKTIDYCRDF